MSVISLYEKIVRFLLLIRGYRYIVIHLINFQYNSTKEFWFSGITVLHIGNAAKSSFFLFRFFEKVYIV